MHPRGSQNSINGHMKNLSFICALPAAACLLCSAFAAEPPATANPAAAGDGVQVGVAKRDGITVSGREAYITRNGATERLSKELALPSGVTMRPDGRMILPDNSEAILKADQLLTLEGKVMNLPSNEGVNANASGTTAGQGGTNASAGGGSTANGPSNQPNQRGTGGSQNMPANQNGTGGIIGVSDGGFTTPTGNPFPGNSLPNGNQNQRVFVGSDGVPFMGSFASDGSIVTQDGRTVANDGSVRSVNFDRNGNPTAGTINRDGSSTQPDGSTISRDGTVRSADGRVISTPQQNQNTAGSNNTNSPNNAGTVNNPNGNPVTGRPANTAGQGGTQPNNGTAGGNTGGAAPTTGGGTQGGGSPSGGAKTGGTGGGTGGGGAKGGAAGGAGR